MVDISVFYDEAASRISGAPIDVLRQQLEGTLREFYVRSGAFLTLTPAMNVKGDKVAYNFNPQPEGEILTIYSVLVDEVPVRFHGAEEPGSVILVTKYPEDKDKALTAVVSLRPFKYDLIPEETVTFDFDTILDGVTGRMFMMPDRPWSNGPQAEYYLRRFRQGQGQARVRVKSRFTQQAAGWKFPPW